MQTTQHQSNEIISLLRLSTAEQNAGDRSGLDRQRSINRETAARCGLVIRREIEAVDVSGRHVKDDPQFQQLFRELATDPTLTGIVVSEQSRLFRPEQFGDYSILDIFSAHKKLIYTPGEVIDAASDAGVLNLTLNGMMSGQELRKIKDRCNTGKRILRERGGNPGGNHTLPGTVRYVRERNADGKVTGSHWELVPLAVERVKRAYDLLFAGYSYQAIADEVGGWSDHGIRRLLQNPIHIGIRRYGWALSPEYLPRATAKNPNPKPKRRSVASATPYDVPTRAELIAGTKAPIVPPIISIADWDRAQEIMAARITTWRKTHTKLDESGRDRFLLNQGYCSCGEPLYVRYGSRDHTRQPRPHLDTYICRSRFNNVKRVAHGEPMGCQGAWGSIRRTDLEAAVCEAVIQLADRAFISRVLSQVLAAATRPDPAQADRAKAAAKLENGRKELLAMVRAGDITRSEFKAEIDILERESNALASLAPPARPALDPAAVAAGLIGVFQGFDTLPFERQRAILRGAIKSVRVDGIARTIVSVTVAGGYLGTGANVVLPPTSHHQINAVRDFVLQFPQPILISDTSHIRRRKAA
jgi:DNA invertase Pin-like site-specific DNA recombinase